MLKRGLSVFIMLILLVGCSNSRRREPSSYYTNLREVCREKSDENCCLVSVNAMESNYAKIAPKEGCPDGYRREMLKCMSSFAWCERKR